MIKAMLAGSAVVISAIVGLTITRAPTAAQQPQARHADALPRVQAAVRDTVVVYKSPTCGCCGKWVDHMRAAGFTVQVNDLVDVAPVKRRLGVGAALESCHTATVGGYVVEGHVPADLIRRMLRERPAIAGLAAPGMPAGSPGMDIPNSPQYDILAFTTAGRTTVYARR